MTLQEAIARVVARRDLSQAETAEVIGRIMEGEATPAQIGGLLIALRMKGETPDELAGAARAMRARATPIQCDAAVVVDTCGTGGDGAATINVSTIAAFVVAACGVTVAKHGNRALSSRCGSADVLEALGVAVAAPVAVIERCLREVKLGFMFAPAFHAATRHVGGPRKELGTRTLFNLLGPMTNPAGARRQVIGVFDSAFAAPMAQALGQLGSERVLVVHGAGGLDEIAVAGETQVAELRGGQVHEYAVSPRVFGLAETDPAGLAGGAAADNAAIALEVLHGGGGQAGAPRAAVVMAAAATLLAAEVAPDLRAAARRAEAALDSGAAREVLDRLVKVSHGAAA
ncbi:MAG: anthranilate phosphoribosyltransferase [Deltaproteobacteria bacterium]|nr:anthranilate phosphoribosyltransferase [Deltaproteobacteria bacterium]